MKDDIYVSRHLKAKMRIPDVAGNNRHFIQHFVSSSHPQKLNELYWERATT